MQPFQQDEDGRRSYPFGNGLGGDSRRELVEGVSLVQLPISTAINEANDSGLPLTLNRPKDATTELAAFRDLASIVSRELLQLQYGSSTEGQELVAFEAYQDVFDVATVTLSLDKTKGQEKLTVRLFSDSNAIQLPVAPSRLRSRNPKTGDVMPDSPFLDSDDENFPSRPDPVVTVTKAATRKRSPSILPTKVERRGRYGFAVEWADGATIIYSMRSIARTAGGELKQ